MLVITMLLQAFKIVFATWSYRFIALVSAILFLSITIFIPVWFIPSNTLSLTLSLMHLNSYIALIILSIISGVVIAFNVFLFHQHKENVTTASGGGFGLFASFTGAVFATSCGCGLGILLGVFGISIGGTSLLITHQFLITLASIVLVLIGLYLSTKRVIGVCALKINS